MHSTLSLASVNPHTLPFYNEAVGRGRALEFRLHQRPYRLEFRPSAGSLGAQFGLRLRLNNEAFRVELDRVPSLAQSLQKPDFPSLNGVSDPLRQMMVEFLLGELLDQLELEHHLSLTLENVFLGPQPATEPCQVPFNLGTETDGLIHGLLYCNEGFLQRLLPFIRKSAPVRPNRFGYLSCRLILQLGQATLNTTTYESLRHNDIILLEEPQAILADTFTLRLPAALLSLKVQIKANRATVLSVMSLDPDSSTKDANKPAPDLAKAKSLAAGAPKTGSAASTDQPPPLAALPIRLTFEAGDKEMTLQELQSIQPGYVFELSNPLEKPIHLKANGQWIGTGELVQIQDHVGVRILEFFDK